VEVAAALDGAVRFAPASSKCPKHPLFTMEILIQIGGILDLTAPLDTAVYACLMMTFWSMA